MHHLKRKNLTIAAAIAAIVLAGCTDPAEDQPGEADPAPAATADAEEEPEPEPEPEETEQDSSGEALQVGESATVGSWEVTITEITPNAADEVAAENEFNEPAEHSYVLVHADLAYNGDETGVPWLDLVFSYHGTDSRFYTVASAVVPDDLMDEPELSNGGTAAGNVVFDIPEDALVGGNIVVEDSFSLRDAEAIWEGVQEPIG